MVSRRSVLLGSAAAGMSMLLPRQLYAANASQPATPVNFQVPPLACDTHVHVFGDQAKYPYAATSGYRHPPASPDELNALHKALHIDRVVIVQPSGYGTDNRATLDGARQLKPRSRAVVAIDEKTTDEMLDSFHRDGARGIRVNIGQTADQAKARLTDATRRIAGRNWHVNTAGDLALVFALQDQIMASPVPVIIDHWVAARPSLGLTQPHLDDFLKLLKTGKIYLKITNRIHTLSTQGPDFRDAVPLAQAFINANPQRILWGSDWPHAGIREAGKAATDVSEYVQIDDGRVFNQLAAWAPDAATRKTILVDNPAHLYDF
jgi:predicted TIM-barrel fold metal-dependent hydrolase